MYLIPLHAVLVPLLLMVACRAPAQLPPITLDEAAHAIRSGVPVRRLEALSRERCFAFTWGAEIARDLRAAGAAAGELALLRTACKRLPPPRLSGSPAPPRPDVALLQPRTAIYRLRGRTDTITQQLRHETHDGHRVVRLITGRRGDGRTDVSETVIDALSFAPVSYASTTHLDTQTSRVTLRRVGKSVEGIFQGYGKRAYALRYHAHEGTLLPGMSDLLLLASTDLAARRRMVLPTFVNTTGAPCLLTLAVERATTVTVPAGTFPAWQVRASGDGCGPAFRLYVSRDAIEGYPPRVILATEGSGYRVELVRVTPL